MRRWVGPADAVLAEDRFAIVANADRFLTTDREKPVLVVFGAERGAANTLGRSGVGAFAQGYRLVYVRLTRRGRYTRQVLSAIARLPEKTLAVMSFEALQALEAAAADGFALGPVHLVAGSSYGDLVPSGEVLRLMPWQGAPPVAAFGNDATPALARFLEESARHLAGRSPVPGDMVLVVEPGLASATFPGGFVSAALAAIRQRHPEARVLLLTHPARQSRSSEVAVPPGERIDLATVAVHRKAVSRVYAFDPAATPALRRLGLTVERASIPDLPEVPRPADGPDPVTDAMDEGAHRAIESATRRRSSVEGLLRRERLSSDADPWLVLLAAGVIGEAEAAALTAAEAAEQPEPDAAAHAGLAATVEAVRADRLPEVLDETLLVERLYRIARKLNEPLAAVECLARLTGPDDEAATLAGVLADLAVPGPLDQPRIGVLEGVAARFAAVRPDIVTAFARRLIGDGNPRAAETLVSTATHFGATPDLIELSCRIHLLLGRKTEAVEAFRRLSAMASGRTPEVEALLDFLVEAIGDDVARRDLVGLAAQARAAQTAGDLAGASRLFEEALVHTPFASRQSIEEPYLDLLAAQGRTAEAEALVRRSLAYLDGAGLSSAAAQMRDAAAIRLSQIAALRGRIDDALDVLKPARAFGSQRAARRIRAIALVSGRLEEDLEDLAAAIAARRQHAVMNLELVTGLVTVGRIADAEERLVEFARRGHVPAHLSYAAVAGAILSRTTDLEVPARLLSRAEPTVPAVAWQLARLRRAEGDTQAAEAALSRALTRHAREVNLLIALADLRLAEGRHREAVPPLERALTLRPLSSYVVAQYALALAATDGIDILEARLGQLDRARLESRHLVLAAAVAAERGRLGEAAQLADDAFAREPVQFDVAQAAVLAHLRCGDRPAAEAVAARFAALNVGSATTLARTADLWRQVERHDRAVEAAGRAAALGPFNAPALEFAARAFLSAADNAGGLAVAQRAVTADPSRRGVLVVASQALRAHGRLDEAERHAEAAVAVDPESTAAVAAHAKAAEEAERFEEAERRYKTAERLRDLAFKPPNIRESGVMFSIGGLYRDWERLVEGVGSAVAGIHAACPPDAPLWRGEDPTGKRIVVAIRGGPGDELRFYSAVLPALIARAASVTVIGDGRLQSIFARNFPTARFVVNRWAGRRLMRDAAALPGEVTDAIEPGFAPLVNRFAIGVPRGLLAEHDLFTFNDDVTFHLYFRGIATHHRSPYQQVLTARPDLRAAMRARLDALGPGRKVGIAWRGSYLSANRRAVAFLDVAECLPILTLPGIRFIDFHTKPAEEEQAVLAAHGVEMERFDDLDMINDFETVAALMAELDGFISTATTQRDTAGAFGARGIYSFTVVPGAGEMWRVVEPDRTDCWQSSILHHDLGMYGTRDKVVDAIAERLRADGAGVGLRATSAA